MFLLKSIGRWFLLPSELTFHMNKLKNLLCELLSSCNMSKNNNEHIEHILLNCLSLITSKPQWKNGREPARMAIRPLSVLFISSWECVLVDFVGRLSFTERERESERCILE